MLSELGIEVQTVLGMPPVEFVNLAADLGCSHVSISPGSGPGPSPYGFEPFSLVEDASLRRLLLHTMSDRGVSISLAESVLIRDRADVREDAPRMLDALVELGVTLVNVVTMDPDISRSQDQFAIAVELAADRGMRSTIEFSKSLTITDLDSALATIRHVGRSDFTLLIDTMHVVRSGTTASQLAALDPALIGYCPLSDHK